MTVTNGMRRAFGQSQLPLLLQISQGCTKMALQTYKCERQPSIIGTPWSKSQILDDHADCEEDSGECKHGQSDYADVVAVIHSRQPARCSREVDKCSMVGQFLSFTNHKMSSSIQLTHIGLLSRYTPASHSHRQAGCTLHRHIAPIGSCSRMMAPAKPELHISSTLTVSMSGNEDEPVRLA